MSTEVERSPYHSSHPGTKSCLTVSPPWKDEVIRAFVYPSPWIEMSIHPTGSLLNFMKRAVRLFTIWSDIKTTQPNVFKVF